MAYCKSAVVKGFSLPGYPVFITFFGWSILVCVCLTGATHYGVSRNIFPVFGFYILAVTLVWVHGNDVFCEYGFSALLDLVFFRFVASFRRVGFDTRLSNPVCGLASICCLLGRLCVKFWKLVASHFFTGRALGVKLVVSDRSYIGLFSCACFYITR